MDRKNINRGFRKLRVWQDAIALYVLACKLFTNFPFEIKKVASNSIDAAHSISRNIAEGYCRRSLKEYLNHLNIALGSCGEFHSCYVSCHRADQIGLDEFEQLDQLYYKVENQLIKLIASLQKNKKMNHGKIIFKLNTGSFKLFVYNHYSNIPLFHYSKKLVMRILIEISGYEGV